MNAYSMLNLNFGDWILSCFDIIPKIIYLMYACLASAADAMQLLVRRLCGLDIYYLDGETVEMTDPLTEFINGILGIGNSSGTMQALNTTFWSLAIFALILLALTAIVAIIKAHYNEDVGATSPSKILYGAFKSILTFAIVPVVVVIGFQISGLLLRTLDNITAGTVSEESISGIYGTDNNFAPVGERNGSAVYSSYDLFGFAQPATNSPISGQLFRAAAYQSNRFRLGTYSTLNVNGNGPNLSMGVFGEGPGYDSAEDQNEYLAYQVDYAFMNSLQLEQSYSYTTLRDNANNAGNRIDVSNDFHSGDSIESFSKYNVSLIWVYYDLWQFNFIIAFAGAISVFGIMLSIIIGLMMRLIKSAAMFLVYPPLLGLAPMDNFKAFKSWANEFIKQILSAFGAIIGINLLFLILPYVQAISFFNQWFLDGVVNLVFLATGLIMVKDFISMVAGFVGGGDVFSTGEGAKGQVAGTLKKGVTAAVGAGAGYLGASSFLPAVVARGAQRRWAGRENGLPKKIRDTQQAIEANKKAIKDSENDRQIRENSLKETSATQFYNDEMKTNVHGQAAGLEYETAYRNAKAAGKTDSEATALGRQAAENELRRLDSSYEQRKNSYIQNKIDNDVGLTEIDKTIASQKESLGEQEKKLEGYKEKTVRNYLNEDGTLSAQGAFRMIHNTLPQSLGAFKLFAKDITGSLNLDKLAGTFKTLTFASTGRDAQGNQAIKSKEWKSGDSATNLRTQVEREAVRQGFVQGSAEFEEFVRRGMREGMREGIGEGIKKATQAVGRYFVPGINVGAGEINYSGEKLQKQQLKATEKQIKASENTTDKIDKLISTMESFIKNSGK